MNRQLEAFQAEANRRGAALTGLEQLERARMAFRARQARGDKPASLAGLVPEPRRPIAARPRRPHRTGGQIGIERSLPTGDQ